MSNVQKTYFFGDLSHIIRGYNWENLTWKINNRKTDEINEPLSFQLQNGKTVTCYIQSTRWGDDSYPFSNFDSNELTKILYQPEYIHVESGKIGLVCLNDLVESDDELATIIHSVKENDWGAVFLTSDTDSVVLYVDDEDIEEEHDCPYCDGTGLGNCDNEYEDDVDVDSECAECHGSGEVVETDVLNAHCVYVEKQQVFKVLS